MCRFDARPFELPELDARMTVHSERSAPALAERLSALTPREREVYRGIDAGLSVREIASLLSRSAKTIEFHRRNARAKLHVQGRLPDDKTRSGWSS